MARESPEGGRPVRRRATREGLHVRLRPRSAPVPRLPGAERERAVHPGAGARAQGALLRPGLRRESCPAGWPGIPHRGGAAGQHVEVRFRDGEVIVGTADSPRTDALGFFLVPADPESNNLRVYVVAAATRAVYPLPSRADVRRPARPRLAPTGHARPLPPVRCFRAVCSTGSRGRLSPGPASGPTPSDGGHACTRSMRSSAGSGTPRRASSSTGSRRTSGSRSTTSSG